MPPASRHDPGVAAERTRLSWRRTSLTATISALLLVALALQHQSRSVAIAVSAVAALCWVILIALVQRRVSTLPGTPVSARLLVLFALACLSLGILGVVLITL